MSCTPAAPRNKTALHGNRNKQASLLSVLEKIRPDLPASLFCDQGYERMAGVASRLPAELCSFWGFECRLASPQAYSDILFEIRKNALGPAVLAGEKPSSLDTLCYDLPVWNRLRSFARDWIDTGLRLYDCIRNVWLEMDIAEARDEAQMEKAVLQPNVFFGPKEKMPHNDLVDITCDILARFGRSTPTARVLSNFLHTLPQGAGLFQVGLMLTRSDDFGLRVCVDQILQHQIPAWLQRLFSKDEACSYAAVLDTIYPVCRSLCFGFNLTQDGIAPGIGVECYQDWLNEDSGQWALLLQSMVEKKLCRPEKAQGILDYPGITNACLKERVLSDIIYGQTYRRIHHLKLTLHQGGIAQAKGYLAVYRPGLGVNAFCPEKIWQEHQKAGQAWVIH